ncbi:caspase-1-A-like [Etheostoma cragini]|uniref:caspase-1-A-like n=1 Tax=Etheostoma cragini TaxID=417921 RepID=UPI00155F034C|nr:caspase-1-A-like [Etheostoma cragini]
MFQPLLTSEFFCFIFPLLAELARVRRNFVEKVDKVVIKQLLDDLLGDGVLSDGQKDAILEENNSTADKARCLIDIIKKKGDVASLKMIAHLYARDSTLHSELGLSCGPPAQPAADQQMNIVWSTTLIPTTEAFWMEKVKDGKTYPADKNSIRNRVALLITNIKFKGLSDRNGADKDEENMEKLLKALGYQVVKYTNLTGKKIDDAVRDFSEHPKLKETDSVVVVIMSHGKLGKVLGCDHDDENPDEFPINNIYKHLDSENCPALLNKPKIIFIQACRGENKGSVLLSDGAGVRDDASQPGPPLCADNKNIEDDNSRCVHKEKDFTCLLSSTPDTISFRHRVDGSFLIQYIVDVFNTFACKEHIHDLFLKVTHRFEEHFIEGQMPNMDRVSLTKHFYFFPGL